MSLLTSDDGTKVVREEKHIQKKEIKKEYSPQHNTIGIPPNTNNTKLFTITNEEVIEILEVVLKNEKVVFIKDKKELVSKVNKEIT